MLARDIMTTKVVTVTPDTRVEDIARLLLDRGISAVPVLEADGSIVGVVSEGDLMRRPEAETERRPSWWLNLVTGPEERARDYIKAHGHTAADVMSRNVVSVAEDTPVGEIARILEKKRIKRVPVMRDGKLIGLVSRANLLHGLATHRNRISVTTSPDDRTIREQILALAAKQGWVSYGSLNVLVNDGVAELWGWVDSDEERKALLLAVQEVEGVRAIEDHLGSVAPYLRAT
ncbi:MAG: CBS domain-containing protein [Kiloniellales bacterium]|nr:CBS domain-containing protein [Kiloniellales bacterium]